jgi:polysaccharide export outer membrane protein
MRLKWLALVIAGALAGCGGLPASGPSAQRIAAGEAGLASPYVVVKINEKVANVAGSFSPPSFSSLFKVEGDVPSIRLAKGDKIAINIFEAGADGLFSSATAKATQIEAVIGQDGRVFVPYVGALQAAGRTVDELRANIERQLEDKAIQPQVQVQVAESLANSVTVLGDVAQPGQVPLALSGVRILDLIAAAGGAASETYQTRVVLRRGNTVASANLEDVFDDPSENVPVRPGDTILVTKNARTFTVFGATEARAEYRFDQRRITLAEGLAKAGGLNDELADARGIFVFRFEPDHIAKALDERAVTAAEGSMVPVIYRLNLKDPNSFFLAKTFNLRDEDMIYVATHPSAELGKFLRIVSPVVSTATTVATLTNRFDN